MNTVGTLGHILCFPQAVAVNDGGKGLAKDAVDVANEFDFICCTAAAGCVRLAVAQ
jgi:hypothetical protein